MRLARHQHGRTELESAGCISGDRAAIRHPARHPRQSTGAAGLHCFVASKAPWFEITDDLPQYPDYPPV
jgi:hypothetical protein